MKKNLQVLLAFIFMLLLVVGGYLAGAYTTYFDDNACYSDVLEALSRESQFVAAEKSDVSNARYKAFLSSLPVNGANTSCPDLLDIIKKRSSIPNQ